MKLEARSVDYAIPKWRKFLRYVTFAFMLGLNITMVASTFELHSRRQDFNLTTSALSVLAVLLLDALILVPVLLEATQISLAPDAITLHRLFGMRTFKWQDIKWFGTPRAVNCAILLAGKSIYLISGKDMQCFADLVAIIASRRHKTGKN